MKTIEHWFKDYEVSHKNRTNKLIHYYCVPLIVYSLLGLLDVTSIYINLYPPISLAYIFIVACGAYYFALNFKLGAATLVVTILMVLSFHLFENPSQQLYTCLIIFALSWAFQFLGHKIEGKKPSFLQDLAYLLIGPLWVTNELTKRHLLKG